MDKWVGPDFETGLANLSAYAEHESAANAESEQQTMQAEEIQE